MNNNYNIICGTCERTKKFKKKISIEYKRYDQCPECEKSSIRRQNDEDWIKIVDLFYERQNLLKKSKKIGGIVYTKYPYNGNLTKVEQTIIVGESKKKVMII